ncbi:MAG: hypothetical protein LBS14_02180 [Holosporaceae bacterium]|jgi:8-oxo-dGTP pyrophosphatase MutT (NUDIX family)|nr:hypothetical protein [Holosporaceae bacterium]
MKKKLFVTFIVGVCYASIAMDPPSLDIKVCSAGVAVFGNRCMLIGKRNDDGTWCSFGGKADPSDIRIYRVAKRETAEESMGVFNSPREHIKRWPYHELHSENGSRFRMYFTVTDAPVAESVLNKKLEASTGHSREYEEFLWLPVSTILSALRTPELDNGRLKVRVHGRPDPLIFMEDFTNMLHQLPVTQQLEAIEAGRPLALTQTFSTWDSGEFESISFPDPDAIAPGEPPFQPGSKTAARAFIYRFSRTRTPRVVALAPLLGPDTPHPFSPTQAYLRLTLRGDYEHGTSRAILEANLRRYMDILVKEHELHREIEVTEADITRLARFLEFEISEFQQGRVVLYHGLEGPLLLLYRYFSAWHAFFRGETQDGIWRLRGTDIPFINPRTGAPYTIDETLGLQRGDYAGDKSTLLLCVNPVLTLGPGRWSHSTSSSIEYFLNSHSVLAPKIEQMLIDTFVLFGMPPELAQENSQEILSIIAQFFGADHPENGGLLAFSLSSDQVDLYTRAVYGGGALFSTPSVREVLENLIQAALKGSVMADAEIKSITSEARLLLHPGLLFPIRAEFRHPLTAGQERLLNDRLLHLLDLHLIRWLKHGMMPFPGSIYSPTSEIPLLTAAGEAGFQLKEIDNILPMLVSKGWMQPAEYFLGKFPDALSSGKDLGTIMEAFTELASKNSPTKVAECIAFFLKYGLSEHVQEWIPEDAIKAAFERFVSLLFKDSSSEIAESIEFFSKYELGSSVQKVIPETTKETIAVRLVSSFLDRFEEITSEQISNISAIRMILGESFSGELSRIGGQGLLRNNLARLVDRAFAEQLGAYFDALGLNFEDEIQSFLLKSVNDRDYTWTTAVIIQTLCDHGYLHLDPNTPEGMNNFAQLLSNKPYDISLISHSTWRFLVRSIVQKYSIPANYPPFKGYPDKTIGDILVSSGIWLPLGTEELDSLLRRRQDEILRDFEKTGNLLSEYVPNLIQLREVLAALSVPPADIESYEGALGLFLQLNGLHSGQRNHPWMGALHGLTNSREFNWDSFVSHVNKLDDLGVLWAHLPELNTMASQKLLQDPLTLENFIAWARTTEVSLPEQLENPHFFVRNLLAILGGRDARDTQQILGAWKENFPTAIDLLERSPGYTKKKFVNKLIFSPNLLSSMDKLVAILGSISEFNPDIFVSQNRAKGSEDDFPSSLSSVTSVILSRLAEQSTPMAPELRDTVGRSLKTLFSLPGAFGSLETGLWDTMSKIGLIMNDSYPYIQSLLLLPPAPVLRSLTETPVLAILTVMENVAPYFPDELPLPWREYDAQLSGLTKTPIPGTQLSVGDYIKGALSYQNIF